MRYYEFVLKTDAETIRENAKINLKEYDYSDPIAAVNTFMYRTLDNDLTFLMYRVKDGAAYSVFSFNEQSYSFHKAYNDISDRLKENRLIETIMGEPCEISMFRYSDCLKEANRRNVCSHAFRIAENANIELIYHDLEGICTGVQYGCKFEEMMIPVAKPRDRERLLYDRSLLEELSNISSRRNDGNYRENLVHYVVSGRSTEAVTEIAGMLAQSLYRAERLGSRRMEVVREINSDLYCRKAAGHIEKIIENNQGGMILIDLTEILGEDPVDYELTSRFIEGLLKRYRKTCLFVFTYNMEHPGFSYFLLPRLQKYVIPVTLREGSGDRKAAIRHMKFLIEQSEYAAYTAQAEAYMERYPGKRFSQTDVLTAFEQFGPWCLNRNVFHAYNYDLQKDFMTDRDENAASSYEMLHQMIGLKTVKEQIDRIIATDIVETERKKRKGTEYQPGMMHMVFSGNPGSAKTTVARLFAGIAKEKGILKSGAFVERGGMDLDGFGCVFAIRRAFKAAKGGVLFIDEAYSMRSDTAVTVLIQELENHREDVIVIFAGYNERMHAFMEINEGLKSRVPYWIEFPDYDTKELTEIFRLMVRQKGCKVTEEAVKEASYIFDKVRCTDNFGNGRYVRNLLERAISNQSDRLLARRGNAEDIRQGELFLITKKDICMLEEMREEERRPGTAKKELEEMVGLSEVKEVINKAVAGFKLRKLCMERGIRKEHASLHMVFTGNPGTAKTTVARLFAEIMKDEKILPTGTFVETGRADLVGIATGTTALLVKRKFREAQGGVLFIDEAYALCDAYENGYGDEAINTLVQEMENHRDDVIVVFAGYPEPMQKFLDRNPGMKSRIAFHIGFEDYSTKELCDIARLMLKRRQMTITDEAMGKLKAMCETARTREDYGNGRYVRKLLEGAEMSLAERLMHLDESEITTELLTTIEACDLSDPSQENQKETFEMGFVGGKCA